MSPPATLPGPRAPGHPITAHAIITDVARRILILRSASDPDRWQLPGGLVEADETPREALRREVAEEIGVEVEVKAAELMSVEWVPARRPGRHDRLALVFTGPVLTPKAAASIRLQATEVTDYRWQAPHGALAHLHPLLAARIREPLQQPGSTLYRETRIAERTPE
ncbi:NUDIX domain-containing protein [Streptomyces sp. NPDC102487]|uniref:NUDIX domain-containing protein n=1 Tax=Streptomyces sp. NPDC102487 TaxID=3366182 RepID=UPI003818AEA4